MRRRGLPKVVCQHKGCTLHESDELLLRQQPQGKLLPSLEGRICSPLTIDDPKRSQRDLFAYIEGYCNRQRIHSLLGYVISEQVERKAS